MYEAVADKPLSVASLRVEPRGGGGEPAPGLRTAQALLDRELQRVYDARSLREVHAALEEAVEHLRQLEVFRRIDALIDEGVRGRGRGLRFWAEPQGPRLRVGLRQAEVKAGCPP
jgi:hypothetical protein